MKKLKPCRNAVASGEAPGEKRHLLARGNENEKASVINVQFAVDYQWKMRPSREKSRRVPCDTQRVIVVTNSEVYADRVRSNRTVVAQRFIGTIRDRAAARLA